MSGSDEEVLRFIAASFPSVWALEVLLILKREPRVWTNAELVAALRASDLVLIKAVDALVAAGLASTDEQGVCYRAANEDGARCVEQVEQLYRARPDSVRRAIVSARSRSASAFADAFKLWGGRA